MLDEFTLTYQRSFKNLIVSGRLLMAWTLITSWFFFVTVKSNDSGIQQSSDDGRESLPSTVSANSLYEPGEFWWNPILIGICWQMHLIAAWSWLDSF